MPNDENHRGKVEGYHHKILITNINSSFLPSTIVKERRPCMESQQPKENIFCADVKKFVYRRYAHPRLVDRHRGSDGAFEER